MSLTAVLDAFVATLSGLADLVTSEPPSSLQTQTTILVYERPGDSTAINQNPPAFQTNDVILVEYHFPIPSEVVPSVAIMTTRETIESARMAIWREFRTTRMAKTLLELRAIRTEFFGPMKYGEDITFGFRLAADAVHADLVT